MKILVLGGAGAMAEVIERDLLESGAEVIVADRDPMRVKQRLERLKNKRATGNVLDVKAKNFSSQLKKTGANVLVNSTWYELNMLVMPAAIKAGMHYIDLGGLFWKTKKQLKLKKAAKDAGTVCVLGMGSTPGIMNVLAEHGSHKFDTLKKIELRCASALLEKLPQKDQFVPPYSIKTLIDEILMPPPVFRNGRIVFEKPLGKPLSLEFENPVGNAIGYYTIHSELATLPRAYRAKKLKELDFAYAYDSEAISIITALKKVGITSKEKMTINNCTIAPYDFIAEIDKRLPRPEKDTRDVEVLRADLWGTFNGKKQFVRVQAISHYHDKWKKSAGTVDTGVPISIVAQWISQGKITKHGVWAPEEIIEPVHFFKELKKRNIDVYEQINHGRKNRLN